ncbi:MAG: hypothetical protein M1120_00560 [Patescibacteria group bacterium]|nr:hypothetical protein [Patescibacteria group bacterium]
MKKEEFKEVSIFTVDGKGTTRVEGVDLTLAELCPVLCGIAAAAISTDKKAATRFATDRFHAQQLIKGARDVVRVVAKEQVSKPPKYPLVIQTANVLHFAEGLIKTDAKNH